MRFRPIRFLLDTIYPPVCEGCGEPYFKGVIPNLCDDCQDSLLFPVIKPFCPVCGQPYPGQIPRDIRCGNCGDRELCFDFSVAAYRAKGRALDWIHRFKYGKEIHFARCFGHLMTRVWRDERLDGINDWLVVPVPIHRRRLRERGFNQSLELARQWVKQSPPGKNLRLINAISRTKDTSRQATLDRKERLINLGGAFAFRKSALRFRDKNLNIILVDDVLTTGTTASECASVLRENLSPNKIVVITVLRA